EVLQALASALANSRHALAGSPPETRDPLLGALAKALDALLRALAEAFDALLGAAADTGDSPLGSLADVLNRAPGSLADAANHIAGVAEQIVRSAAHVPERLAHALEQLRVAVERSQDAREDLRDLLKADLEQRLRFHVLDVELDLPQSHRGAGVQLHEMPRLGEQGEMSPEVVELELDLFDPEDGHVDEHVHGLFELLRIGDREVRHILACALAVGRSPASIRTRKALRAAGPRPALRAAGPRTALRAAGPRTALRARVTRLAPGP